MIPICPFKTQGSQTSSQSIQPTRLFLAVLSSEAITLLREERLAGPLLLITKIAIRGSGEAQQLKPGKLTISVGPNNSGNSQFLRDIRDRMIQRSQAQPIIISDIEFKMPATFDEMVQGLSIRLEPREPNTIYFARTLTGDSIVIFFDCIPVLFRFQGRYLLRSSEYKNSVKILSFLNIS